MARRSAADARAELIWRAEEIARDARADAAWPPFAEYSDESAGTAEHFEAMAARLRVLQAQEGV